ncbi:MAG: HAMP domain-containing sensor histidine kinase [Bacteroidota bacterium]
MPTAASRPLRRLAVALLALAIVPAGAFAVLQGVIQSESERQLAEIRDEQLDGLLFSVNQDAWDTASLWADRLTRATASTTDFQQRFGFLSGNPAIRYVVESDTTGEVTAAYGAAVPPGLRADGDATGYDLAPRVEPDALFPPERVRLLLDQHAAGYRKLEPVPLEGGLALLFVADGATPGAPPRLLAMVLDPGPFVNDVVMPKLRDVAQGGVDLGVFVEDEDTPIASTRAMAHKEIERERPLWLLPAHTVGARVGEGSVEVALRRRIGQSLGLFGGVSVILAAGAWFAWRGVRREVEVARLREDFVSNVSHELRTPLALIRMYAESLAQGRVKEERKPRYYETIVDESERLSRLVGNVLHFNRFERGTASVARGPMNLAALAAEIGERYRPIVEREGGRLELHLDEVPPIHGDRDLLSEALVNLIDNAVKYGGGDIEISTRALAADAVLTVADRGPGIDEAERQRVFEPFVRLQPESADGLVHTAKGTGLGLALVHRIAASHGGVASVHPRDGGGSVFQITIPTHSG